MQLSRIKNKIATTFKEVKNKDFDLMDISAIHIGTRISNPEVRVGVSPKHGVYIYSDCFRYIKLLISIIDTYEDKLDLFYLYLNEAMYSKLLRPVILYNSIGLIMYNKMKEFEDRVYEAFVTDDKADNINIKCNLTSKKESSHITDMCVGIDPSIFNLIRLSISYDILPKLDQYYTPDQQETLIRCVDTWLLPIEMLSSPKYNYTIDTHMLTAECFKSIENIYSTFDIGGDGNV